MNKEELQHYLKGGKFFSIYSPVKMDINAELKAMVGEKIIVYQNMMTAPLVTPVDFIGQHAFNSDQIYGWFPEEDIGDLTIIDQYIEFPEPLPKYMYRLTYAERSQIKPNFGIGYENKELPLIVGREYSSEMDEYIRTLSNPPASMIEKCVWHGEDDEVKWNRLY